MDIFFIGDCSSGRKQGDQRRLVEYIIILDYQEEAEWQNDISTQELNLAGSAGIIFCIIHFFISTILCQILIFPCDN